VTDAWSPQITSAKNPRIKAALDLRDRRGRERAGATLVDGVREIARALAGGARVSELFVDESRLRGDAPVVVDRARAAGARITEVAGTVIDRLAYGERSDGLLAIAGIPDTRLDALVLPDNPLLVVLEAVEKPGNLGAVLRSADGAGADAVIAADPRTDLFNPNAIRASLGTIFTVPVAAGPSGQVRDRLARAGVRILAARVDGSVPYTEVDLTGPLAVVLGSEADGLSDAWTGDDVTAIHLPMLGIADSLNVSIAAAVLLYEARRQRG
jgi:RNA methyltransferase, TrmH family